MLSVVLLLRISSKKPTSFQNPKNPYYIDLMLTNSPKSFQNLCAIKTGLFDFHKITATILKIKSENLKPRIKHYKDYRSKTLSNYEFRNYFLSKLPMEILVLLIRVSCTGSLGGVSF